MDKTTLEKAKDVESHILALMLQTSKSSDLMNLTFSLEKIRNFVCHYSGQPKE